MIAMIRYPITRLIGLFRAYDLVRDQEFVRLAIVPAIEAELSIAMSRIVYRDLTHLYLFLAGLREAFESEKARRDLVAVTEYTTRLPKDGAPKNTMEIEYQLFPENKTHTLKVFIVGMREADRDCLYQSGYEPMRLARKYLQSLNLPEVTISER